MYPRKRISKDTRWKRNVSIYEYFIFKVLQILRIRKRMLILRNLFDIDKPLFFTWILYVGFDALEFSKPSSGCEI